MNQTNDDVNVSHSSGLHQNKPKRISFSAALEQGFKLIDVRAPIEFDKGSIPESINFPLLHDAERHEIGILYKRVGQSAAIAQGYEILEKNYPNLKSEILKFKDQGTLVLSCARGGMRSQIMVNLFSNFGIDCYQLEGGYKAYRNWVLTELEQVNIPKLVVLQGQTGVAKTKILELLDNSIDLEGLAHHRGSLFGGIGLTPTSQKNFEALLVQKIKSLDLSKAVFIEGESRKIGPINLPSSLYQLMQKSPTILLTAPLAIRVKRIIEEYILEQSAHGERFRELLEQLKEAFGKKGLAQLLEDYDQGHYEVLIEKILVEYYDPKYQHCLNGENFAHNFDSSNLAQVAEEIKQAFLNE